MSIAEIHLRTQGYLSEIDERRSETIQSTELSIKYNKKQTGKVRDVYLRDDCVIMIATDRQSAFDRNLASVPFKGSLLLR